jgi:pimeloyl-ACP methyl ester carboxylesterase
VRLTLRSWGSGPATALLVHGFSDDSSTWWRVGPALAERGFTVIAPDLRGHGLSPRAEQYALDGFAQDLVESLPADADLAVGHSLGALVLALAAPALRPRRTVLVDPSWLRPRRDIDLTRALPTAKEQLPAETAAWDEADVRVDLASNALLDPRVGPQLLAALGPDDHLPATPPAGPDALVVVPEHMPLLPVERQDEVAALGYSIRTVPAAHHVIHRDNHAGFLDAVLLVDETVG